MLADFGCSDPVDKQLSGVAGTEMYMSPEMLAQRDNM